MSDESPVAQLGKTLHRIVRCAESARETWTTSADPCLVRDDLMQAAALIDIALRNIQWHAPATGAVAAIEEK
jgi:hypothetical protein